MPAYVELPIDDDQTIYVEVTDDGLQHTGPRETVEKVTQRLDDAIDRVISMGRRSIEKARDSVEPPQEIQVELGLKLTAKTGFVVAESTGEAQFRVNLKWVLDKRAKP
jgi:hypothetical protein